MTESQNPVLQYARELFGESRFFNREDAPLRAHLTEGHGDSRVLVVAGTNASGKSFAVRVLSAWLNDEASKVEPLQVSMKYRTAAGIHRAFMFGPFGDEQGSTGSVSLSAVEGGLRSASGRESPCWLLLDEPDVGLSEDFGYAMGAHLAAKATEGLGGNWQGLVVVTHSRELVAGIGAGLPAAPHFVHVADEPLTLGGWLASGRRRSVEELLALPKTSNARHRAIGKILQD